MYQDESDLEDFLKLNNEAYLKGVRGDKEERFSVSVSSRQGNSSIATLSITCL